MKDGSALEDCQIEIVRYPGNMDKWNLVKAFLRLRTNVFVDQMSWNLHVHDGLEFEQYDTLAAVYVIAHQHGKVVGGARLLRTDNKSGIYGYMIRDAYLGRLEGLPRELCEEEPPFDRDTWELTRFIATTGAACSRGILMQANDFLRSQNAKKCLFLGPPAFMRMAKFMRFAPRPLGPVSANQDGRFLAFECAVI
ncbi:acyl-homoserine-lactone synthase [Aliiroseovarius sp. PTFE2010]|uniref:acyl-homoserine-lactone synthase n=1 Tax=Aliiroseovarius sp. PTFE2010 TaxID=3417190 RepID=UPI003CF17D2C